MKCPEIETLSSLEDTQLVSELLKGQTKAFDELYRRYEAKLMGFLINKSYSRELAEESFQLVWEKVYKKAPTFKNDLSFSTWLYSIAQNTIIDKYRRYEHKKNYLQYISDRSESNQNITHNSNLKSESLYSFIEKLKEPYKSSLLYKYKEGLTNPVIAKKMNLKDSNLRKILSRGIRKLKLEFAAEPNNREQNNKTSEEQINE